MKSIKKKATSLKASEVFKVGKNQIGYVWSSFLEHFGKDEVLPGKPLPKFHKLTRSMTDSQIISEFGIQECTLGDVLATMDTATSDMKDGYSNIFYIKGHPSRVVRVRWSSFYGKWVVDYWGRGGFDWLAGYRVFSPATGSVTPSSSPSESLTLNSALKIVKEAGYKIYKEV